MTQGDPRELRVGFLYTLSAFVLWGLAPVFWKFLGHVEAEQQLAHRIVWCALIMIGVLALRGRLAGLGAVLGKPKTFLLLTLSTVAIGCNWFFFIWSIATEQIVQTSLGYYINPLVSVVLGLVFLRETLRPLQWVACGLALVGVAIMTWRLGTLPWLSLVLAFSFGFYGLLRKTVPAGPEEGLALETWLLSPLALLYLWQRHAAGEGSFLAHGPGTTTLLVVAGLITAVPLLLFTHGARRIPLATVGMLQYVAPTGQFLLAVFAYGEPFDRVQLVSFVVIWTALGLYTWDARRAAR